MAGRTKTTCSKSIDGLLPAVYNEDVCGAETCRLHQKGSIMTSSSVKYKGILCIIVSAFCFAMMNILVRLSGDLPVIQKSFFRNFIAFFIALLMILKNRKDLSLPRGKGWIDIFLRSIFGTLGIFFNFYAVDHLMVADASMLNKLSPFFVILFSYFILGEKLKPFQGICVLLAFFGSLFVIKPGITGMPLLPSLIGIAGGMCAGIAYTYVRKLGLQCVTGSFIVLFFSGFSCAASLPYILMNYKPMSFHQILILIGTGIAASGGQFFITAAYTYAPASEISIYDYSQIIFVTILSFLILGQVPDGLSFLGYGIILAASLIMFLYNSGRNHEEKRR